MNRFDKEERIIELFQDIDKIQMAIYPQNIKMFILNNLIHNKKKWKYWIDSSAKDALPPDFYNETKKLMMDVMRIDDHAYVDENGRVINPTNERESKVIEEIIKKNPAFKKVVEEGNFLLVPDSGLRGEKDHNYTFYINNFKRVVEKHIKKIPKYQKNHPGYKTIFLVFDESSPYVKCINNVRPTKIGEKIFAEPHLWWLDYNMLNILKDSKVDFLLWVTPYKHFDSEEKVELPHSYLIDVSKINFDKLKKYEIKDMASLEA